MTVEEIVAQRMSRCRDCGSPGPDLATAGEHDPWVEDEDDIGYPYCPACVRRLVRRTLTIPNTDPGRELAR